MTGQLLRRLGVDIDPGTLRLALTHRSYAYEQGGIANNERLEFLGDSVLSVSVTDRLYRDFPDLSEGDLAKRRAAVVSTQALARVARTLGLGDYILLGKGEEMSDGRDKSSILADTLEALIGAAYISCGMAQARRLVMRLLSPLIEDAEHLQASLDWKTNIQEYASAQGSEARYEVSSTGPDHAKAYTARLYVGDAEIGQGRGTSKKEAEKDAAQQAWKNLQASRKD